MRRGGKGNRWFRRFLSRTRSAVGGIQAINGYILPGLVDIGIGLRVEHKSCHCCLWAGATGVVRALAPESVKGFFTLDRFHSAGLEVIVSAVKHFSDLGQFLQISRHCLFDEFVGRAPGFGGEFLKARFGFWPKLYLHDC
jgi:hypothetical protein